MGVLDSHNTVWFFCSFLAFVLRPTTFPHAPSFLVVFRCPPCMFKADRVWRCTSSNNASRLSVNKRRVTLRLLRPVILTKNLWCIFSLCMRRPLQARPYISGEVPRRHCVSSKTVNILVNLGDYSFGFKWPQRVIHRSSVRQTGALMFLHVDWQPDQPCRDRNNGAFDCELP